MRRVSVEERRARLAQRHHLAPNARAGDVTDVARSLVGLHATDPATVFLAAAARLVDPTVAAIEHALYVERSLVRMVGMRKTMWVVPTETLPVVSAACCEVNAARSRRDTLRFMSVSEEWLSKVEQQTLDALATRGEAYANELSTDVPELRTKYTYAEGKSYGGTQTATTRILSGLSLAGHIVRGQPRGGWNGSQYRWASLAKWLPELAEAEPVDEAAARIELVRSWLRGFGPATVGDIKWWTGLTMGQVRKALTEIEPTEVELNGVMGLVLADDVGPVPAPENPWVVLLPALDPTAMGWTERGWYLGEHRAALFDRSGNIGPTVWCDGRIVGGWAQRREGTDDGRIVCRLLEDIGSDATAMVEAEAERLAHWIGDVRVLPRFRTPLERQLTA